MIMPLKFEKFNFRSFEMADHNDNIRVKVDEKSIYQQEFDKNIMKIQEYQPRRKREKIFTYKITIMFNFIN